MKFSPVNFALVSISQIIFSCSLGYGWGGYGHRVIAAIAERYLEAKTKEEIVLLLGRKISLPDIAEWAEDVRAVHSETASWHFVNIPKTRHVYQSEPDCPKEGCLISAMEQFTEVLADHKASKSERAKALKFVVHLAGDLHQPLHCGYTEDKGGNTIRVVLKQDLVTLHRAWDSGILELHKVKYPKYAAQLCEKVTNSDVERYQNGTILDWVTESRVILKETVYTFNSDQILDQDYVDRSLKVIDLQLLKAGIRLASLLNAAFNNH